MATRGLDPDHFDVDPDPQIKDEAEPEGTVLKAALSLLRTCIVMMLHSVIEQVRFWPAPAF